MSRKKVIIANWKCNPVSLREAILLAKKIEQGVSTSKNVETVIAPPFPFLQAVRGALKKSKLGAQDAFWSSGPFTGEVSPSQLKGLGVEYVILGHSERKIHLGETDEMINKKIKTAHKYGLAVVLCIGEKERSEESVSPVLGEQLKKSLEGVKKSDLKNLVVAYESVWAISTNKTSRPDTPENVFRAKIYISKILANIYGNKPAEAVRIIYGGSVKPQNAVSFITAGQMDGVLVGQVSLDSKKFAEIVKQAND